jgi:hypothetical protein
MKSEVYKRNVDTWDEFLARILDDAVRIKKREDNSDEQHAIWDFGKFIVECNKFVF